MGPCKGGIQECLGGRWGSNCKGEILPTQEQCNTVDDDCDGKIDESVMRSCPYTGPSGTEGVGLCKAGRKVCMKGQWAPCTGEVKPAPEKCDGKDNDCGGQVDEGSVCAKTRSQPVLQLLLLD